MKKVLGFLLVAAMFATPLSRIALVVSVALGWLLWKESKSMSAQQKLKPIRIPVLTRNSRRAKRN